MSASVFSADPTRLASDGSRIGEIKDAPSATTLALEARAKIERDADADMLLDCGLVMDPKDLDRGLVEAMFPCYNDRVRRRRALAMYAEGRKTVDAIALDLGVPLRTVAKWAESGNWGRLQESTAKTLRALERARLSINRSLRREAILNEQLDLAASIRKKAANAVEESETSSQLKLASEAAKLAADLEVRALGIGESGSVSDDADERTKAEAAGRAPLIINFQGGLPPVKVSTGEAIDVS